MVASEVVVAASQVAAPVAQAPVNWIGVVASSAAIGAAFTAVTTLFGQHLTRRHEKKRLAEQRAPAQLDAALMLEAFAKQAIGYADARAAVIAESTRVHDPDQDDEPVCEPVEWTPLAFDAALAKEWTALPIEIYSACRELPLSLAESDKWTNDFAAQEWVDAADAYEVDRQRAILYGLLAGELAFQIRSAIKVPPSVQTTDCVERLQRAFDELKGAYVQSGGALELIPDLLTRLQRECPNLPEPVPRVAPTVRPADGVA
ncbi:hypothetical protein QM312_35105 [Burkholderia cenocepacia]|uniref:hypothetical protein n=1 Tax=Burkholderia cenocepacia TaxID=95486 RepID=UPI00078D1644|nr:hypothetical protein [Burkholderia cenocepacia]AMU19207.1 hypothetical protein A3203_38940 [Burkholderia cenocepacia]MDI9701179.1 hypothetical protein [Burkholderia cenocepacia]